MKKWLLGLLTMIVVAGSGVWVFKMNSISPEMKIYKSQNNQAVEQKMSNASDRHIIKKIRATGLYLVTTDSQSKDDVSSTAYVPGPGSAITGAFFSKGDGIDVPGGTTITFKPVDFKHLGKNGSFNITNLGRYGIGSDIEPGAYKLKLESVEGNYKTQLDGIVQLVITSRDGKEKIIQISKADNQKTISVSQGEMLQIKSSSDKFNLFFDK